MTPPPFFEPVIGLEVHVQLATRSKMFSSDPAGYGAEPNACTNEVSLGLPGALPTVNARAVELAICAGLALGCTINPWSQFARKHYFYPDLPKGYQITQYEFPLCEHGRLHYDANGERYVCNIRRIHLEEDTGKSLHSPSQTLMDFNRAGIPLIEIVSEPEIRSAAEAAAFLRTLHETLVFLGVTLGNLEEGQFRCDANVSVRPPGSDLLTTRTELKNINSFKFVEAAIAHEISRQVALIDAGGEVRQETRYWDHVAQETRLLRLKEQPDDYRYFPEPDLPPLALDPSLIARLSASLPELPQAKRARYTDRLGLTPYDAQVLTSSKALSALFEAALACYPQNPKGLSNLIQKDLLRLANARGSEVDQLAISAESVADLVRTLDHGLLTQALCAQALELALSEGRTPAEVIEAHNLRVLSDANTLEATIQAVIQANPPEAARYRAGESKLLSFFIGQTMRALHGQADPTTLRTLLQKLLLTSSSR